MNIVRVDWDDFFLFFSFLLMSGTTRSIGGGSLWK